MSEIKQLVDAIGLFIGHCFREANEVADRMAYLSHPLEETHIYNYLQTMPRQVKGLLNVDRWQFPSFQIKKRRSNSLECEPP